MSNLKRLKPVNRHLLVVPHFKEKDEDSAVLLPDGYTPKKEKFLLATVVDVASDCAKQFQSLPPRRSSEPSTVIIDQSMLEEVEVAAGRYHLILENYVVGIIRGINEG